MLLELWGKIAGTLIFLAGLLVVAMLQGIYFWIGVGAMVVGIIILFVSK